MNSCRVFLISIIVCLAALIGPATSAFAETPAKVAIVPFTMNADRDMTFLRNGLADMLASRLTWPGRVAIIDRDTTVTRVGAARSLNDASARTIGKALEADYVLFGSLTIFGDSVSMDAKMVDVSGAKPAVAFFNQAATMSQVIPQVNQFAAQINAEVFNRQTAAPVVATAPAPAPSPGATASSPQTPANVDPRAHPDTLLRGGQVAPQGTNQGPIARTPTTNTSPNQAFIQTNVGRTGGPTFWKSRNYPLRINGIAVGDVNGDGLLETILVNENEIQIAQMIRGRMKQLAKIDRGSFVRQLSVDIADINDNGMPEIFVSSLNGQRSVIESIVYEWNGKAFVPILEDSRYFFRVIPHPIRGDILLGQRVTTAGSNPFQSAISELEWRGGTYESATVALGPYKNVNVLGATMGPIFDDGGDGMVAFLDTDKVRILQIGSGSDEWTSGEAMGGSTVYMAKADLELGEIETPIFLPVRILMTDLNTDGKPETLVIRNHDTSGRHLEAQRFFTKGDIGAYQWDGIGLSLLWRTPEVGGRIQDIAVADFDNDGNKELLAAIVFKEGEIIGTKPKSALIAYDLDLKEK